jgi:predicted N-acetyltransferase YhbS
MVSVVEISHCTSRAELEAVVDLCDRAFPGTAREYFERHVLHDATLRPEDTLIGTSDGRIISTVQVFPRTCWMNGARVRFAGVGNVATLPEHRGAGHAAALMREAIRRMRSLGFAFSMLSTSINAFYERFGFVTVPRDVAVFAPPPAPASTRTVRRFDRERDGEAVQRIYEAYNRGSVGPIARDGAYWRAQEQFCGEVPAMFLVVESAGSVAGYVRGGVTKGSLHVLEFACEREVQSIFATLLNALSLQRAELVLRMPLSRREKERLAPLPRHTIEPDTETMILVLDDRNRQTLEGGLLGPGSLMFWQSDFF